MLEQGSKVARNDSSTLEGQLQGERSLGCIMKEPPAGLRGAEVLPEQQGAAAGLEERLRGCLCHVLIKSLCTGTCRGQGTAPSWVYS